MTTMIEGRDQQALLEFATLLNGHEARESAPEAAPERRPAAPPSMQHVQPTVPGADNWCGQAAVWSLVKYWGRHGGLSDQALIDDIYTRFGPDFLQPFVNAGTSPFRIEEALRAYGLRTHIAHVPVWHGGGFVNPLNQPVWQTYRAWIEDKWINAGFPAITLVDSGMVGGPGYNLHWVVTSRVGATARVHNHLAGGYHDEEMVTARFHEAWEVRFIPVTQIHFLTVLAQP